MLKKYFLYILLYCSTIAAHAQTLPPVPKRITMFDLNIVLDENTRKTIEKEMAFLASKRVYVDAKIAKMAIYFPIIETIFDQEGIPKEFKYLCAQESSFIADAVSTSNAVGFWQFKSSTATDFGLRVDDVIDERKNIIASTRAAAQYLKNNNKTYQNWVSTLLSYRLGLTGAKNQVPSDWASASEITITSDIDWYVIRNIAHFIYFENELEHFTPNGSYLYLYNRAAGKSFADIAEELAVKEVDLRKENLWCNANAIPNDKNYTVCTLIKKDQKAPIIAQETGINKPFFDIEVGYPILKKDEKKSKKEGAIFYTINGKDGILSQKDDTPQSLADRGQIKLQYLLSYNDLDNTSSIKPKTVYYLERKSRKAKAAFHVVKKGENTWVISQMYGVKQKRLLRMNRMDKNEALQEGRILFLNKRRGRKEEIEFERKPIEKQQLPPEIPRVIIENTENTFPNKPIVPEKQIITEKAIEPTPVPNTEPVSTSSGVQMTVIVRDKSEKAAIPITKAPISKVETLSDGTILVGAGETLYSLSKKYNISVDELKKTNNLVDNNLTLGQKLIVAKKNQIVPNPQISNAKIETKKAISNKSEKPSLNYHTVQNGETLYRVSKIYNITVEKIKQLNNLADNTISVGQNLVISK